MVTRNQCPHGCGPIERIYKDKQGIAIAKCPKCRTYVTFSKQATKEGMEPEPAPAPQPQPEPAPPAPEPKKKGDDGDLYERITSGKF